MRAPPAGDTAVAAPAPRLFAGNIQRSILHGYFQVKYFKGPGRRRPASFEGACLEDRLRRRVRQSLLRQENPVKYALGLCTLAYTSRHIPCTTACDRPWPGTASRSILRLEEFRTSCRSSCILHDIEAVKYSAQITLKKPASSPTNPRPRPASNRSRSTRSPELSKPPSVSNRLQSHDPRSALRGSIPSGPPQDGRAPAS